jgi:hypothetical protein
MRLELARPAQQLDAVHARQVLVHQQAAELLRRQGVLRLFGGEDGPQRKLVGAQRGGEQLQDHRLVVDDQHLGGKVACLGARHVLSV